MSILDSLRRLVDPIAHRRIMEDRRRQREAREVKSPADPPLRRCRVCAWEGAGKYCLRCLAETMESRPRER
jgi:hypothetical protein